MFLLSLGPIQVALAFARTSPASKLFLQVPCHGQGQVVVMRASHHLDAQGKAFSTQAQWALGYW